MAVLRTLGAVALAMAPIGASAAQISGQLDVVGSINRDNSTFVAGGFLDFDPETGFAVIASGDFAPIVTQAEGGVGATLFTLSDIDFSSPGVIYQGGGFTFTATSFGTFDDNFPGRSFIADGTITGGGFDATPGTFSLSTQSTGEEEGEPGEILVSFSSTTAADPSPGVIPLPATGLLLLGGLGGLAALRRKRSA